MIHTQPRPAQDEPYPRLTASRLELARSCPGSFALGPHVSPAPGEAAEKGTAIHAFLEAILDGVDPDEALPELPEARAVCEKIDAREVHEVAGPDPSTETPLGWDPATGEAREAPRATTERRDYSALPEGWVAGTADAVSEEDAAVRVTDWKTGAFEVPDPGENPQLLFLGLAAARAPGTARCPRSPGPGRPGRASGGRSFAARSSAARRGGGRPPRPRRRSGAGRRRPARLA